MEYIYYVTLDRTPMSKKPTKWETKKISNRILWFTGLTETEIVRYTQPPFSYTFVGAKLKGKKCSKNWELQNVFVLDFDKGITPQEVIDRFGEYGIIPNIIYYTFSDTPELRKFRVLILVDKVFTDSKEAALIRKGLLLVFPEADKSCSDAARMFFGGKKSEKLSSLPTDITKLSELISIKTITNDKGRTRNLAKNNYFYNYNKNNHISPKKGSYSFSEPQKRAYLETVKQNKFPFEEAINKVKLLQDFDKGIELKHPQLLGLATSLSWIKGGEKYMRDVMQSYNDKGATEYNEDDFNIMKMVKYYDYFPKRLSAYSPYPEDYQYTDLIDAGKSSRGYIEELETPKKVSLSEARKIFDGEYDKAIHNQDNSIYIFLLPTGIGKTEKLTYTTSSTLCFPTHKLKNEVSTRMKSRHVVVPELPQFENDQIKKKIDLNYSFGLNQGVYQILKEVSSDLGYKYSLNDQQLAKNYLRDVNSSYQTDQTVLTTHSRGIFDQHQHNTVIFDEDPLKELLTLKKMSLSDLMALEYVSSQGKVIAKLIDHVRSCKPGDVNEVKELGIDTKELEMHISAVNPDGNLLQFFNSKWLLRDKNDPNTIHYLIQRTLPENKKVIIMSATAQVNFYKAIYRDRVKVIDLSLVQNQGEVIQYTKKSYSRSSLASSDLSKVEEIIGDKIVVTFMKFKSKVINASKIMHFGNCEGYDEYKGMDIVVLGTPHKSEIQYLLYARAMGIDVNNIDTGMLDQKIDWKGFRFKFMSYNNLQLREIQLGLIEADLVQAVGRARALITDAKVTVFSSLPLRIADSFIYESTVQS